jgi:hypothetical protein
MSDHLFIKELRSQAAQIEIEINNLKSNLDRKLEQIRALENKCNHQWVENYTPE